MCIKLYIDPISNKKLNKERLDIVLNLNDLTVGISNISAAVENTVAKWPSTI